MLLYDLGRDREAQPGAAMLGGVEGQKEPLAYFIGQAVAGVGDNDLDRPARVGVRLVGTPTTRFESQDVAPFTIAPGQKATLEVQARVLGSGRVTVAIQLLTPDGQNFGEPVVTSVESAAYASAALWVVSGLFGILVVLLGVNFVRRRRPSAPAAATTEDADA